MMCSRLLKRESPAGQGPRSRRGFYHLLETGYVGSLRLAMRHRWLVCVLAIVVIAANVPLYRYVHQDYVPTNVDESEFEVGVTAPEGASLASMSQTLKAVEAELRSVPGVVHLLSTVGTSNSAAVNVGEVFVNIEDIAGRSFTFGRLWRETLAGQPWAAWQGNYSQRDVMQ